MNEGREAAHGKRHMLARVHESNELRAPCQLAWQGVLRGMGANRKGYAWVSTCNAFSLQEHIEKVSDTDATR